MILTPRVSVLDFAKTYTSCRAMASSSSPTLYGNELLRVPRSRRRRSHASVPMLLLLLLLFCVLGKKVRNGSCCMLLCRELCVRSVRVRGFQKAMFCFCSRRRKLKFIQKLRGLLVVAGRGLFVAAGAATQFPARVKGLQLGIPFATGSAP